MFISTKNRWFSHLASFTTALILFTILMQITLHANTPYLPLIIYGKQIQPYLFYTIIGLVILLTGTAAFLHKQLSYKPFLICLGLILLAIGDWFIDRWDLTLELPSNSLIHFIVSLLILSLSWWLSSFTRVSTYSFDDDSYKNFRLWAWVGLAFIFIQMAVGSWALINQTNLSCTHFPLCVSLTSITLDWRGIWYHPLSTNALITLHMAHQLGAILAVIYFSVLSIKLIFHRDLSELGFLLLLLLIIQISLGALSFVWIHSQWIMISHQLIVAILLLTMISLLISLYRKPREYW